MAVVEFGWEVCCKEIFRSCCDLMTELVASVSKSSFDTVACFEGVSGFPNNNGEYVDSPPFSCEDRTWAVRLYPAGSTDVSGSCSCNLVKLAGPTCRASMEFRIMVNSGTSTIRKVPAKTFNDLRSEWGIGHLINSYNIDEQNNPYILNDTLTIKVTITVFGEVVRTTRESTVGTTTNRAHPPSAHIATAPSVAPSYMAGLFGQKSLADLTIVLSDRKKLDAHRVVLAMRSDVFKSMLSSRMAESNTNQIVIDDCEPKTVRAFIQYLYTDQLPGNPSAGMLSQLLGMANKYQVAALEQACIAAIKRNLSSDNVLEILELATLYGATDLRRAALQHLADFSDRVASSKSFFDKLASFWGNCAIPSPVTAPPLGTFDGSTKPVSSKSNGKVNGKRTAEAVQSAASTGPASAPAGKKARRGATKGAAECSEPPCGNDGNLPGAGGTTTGSSCSSSSGAGGNGTAAASVAAAIKIPDEVCDVISALAGVITDRRNGNLASEMSTRTGSRSSSAQPRHPASNPVPTATYPNCTCPICRSRREETTVLYEEEDDDGYSDEYNSEDEDDDGEGYPPYETYF